VQGGDGGLYLVLADRPGAEGAGEQGLPFGYAGGVPAAAVLLVERHDHPVGTGAGIAAGVGEQHQAEQSGGLGVVGQESVQESGQPDRLGGEVDVVEGRPGACRVALVEQQVQHVTDHAEPLLALLAGRWLEPGSGGADALLRPADPLSDGGLRHQERRGDLRGAQAGDRAQRERELGRWRQRRVAAQEQQVKRVVRVLVLVPAGRRVADGVQGRHRLPAPAGAVGTPAVDQCPAGDGQQPGPWPVRNPLDRPLPRRGEQRLLGGVLAQVELAVPAYERGEDLRCVRAQQVLQPRIRSHNGHSRHSCGGSSMMRRTSIGKPV
jgi:hypothetical protein